MKYFVCILFALVINIIAFAQERVLTIDNQTPGWLSSMITYPQQKSVEELTLTGYINKTDMDFVNGLIQNQSLKILDLTDVRLVGHSEGDDYIWKGFLSYGNKILQKVRLPRNVKSKTELGFTSTRWISSRVDTLEIGYEDFREFQNNSTSFLSYYAPNHLILLEGVRIIPTGTFRFEATRYLNGNSTSKDSCYVTLPSTITHMEESFDCSCIFDTPIVFPDSIVRMGDNKIIDGVGQCKGWWSNTNIWSFNGKEFIFSINPNKFVFPEKLEYYNSKYGYTKSSGGTIVYEKVSHVFNSDTIVVHSNCDTLFAKLNAKVAYFLNKTPVVYNDHEDYNIDTLYVPECALNSYLNKNPYKSALLERCGRHIKEIKAMKKVKSIVIVNNQNECYVGETIQMRATVAPSDAFNKKYHWKSSDESVATVNEKGVVTAMKCGRTEILAISDEDDNIYGSCEINVLQHVNGIKLNYDSYTLYGIGESIQLEVIIEPENASNQEVKWKSSNESVCIVSKGKVVAVGHGTCVIIAITEDSDYMATCTIHVYDNPTIIENTDTLQEQQHAVYDILGRKRHGLSRGINIIRLNKYPYNKINRR